MHVITHIGGKLSIYTALVDANLKANGLNCASATAKQIDASERRSIERQMAWVTFLRSYRVLWGNLIEDLENRHTRGIELFPQTLTEAFVLINNLKNNPMNQKIILGNGVAFINKGGKGSSKTKSKQNKDHITCFKCNEMAITQMSAQMQQKLMIKSTS